MLNLIPEFRRRNIKVIGLSCDSVESHKLWCKDIKNYAGVFFGFYYLFYIIKDQGSKNYLYKLTTKLTGGHVFGKHNNEAWKYLALTVNKALNISLSCTA